MTEGDSQETIVCVEGKIHVTVNSSYKSAYGLNFSRTSSKSTDLKWYFSAKREQKIHEYSIHY